MSTDTAMETPKRQSKMPKDKSERKSSKKRSREEAESTNTLSQASPSKKARTTTASPPTTSKSDQTPTATGKDDLTAHTPFVKQTSSLYLSLSPVAYNFPIQGLCAEHLSPYLLTYYPPLNGILLSYSNPRLSQSPHSAPRSASSASEAASAPIVLAQSVAEYGVSFVWLTADFILLKPKRGTIIEAQVRVQNPSYLGLVCWNFFNANIERARLPKDWTWVDTGRGVRTEEQGEEADDEAEPEETGEGFFVDGTGEKVDGLLRIRVRDFESAPMTERERGFVAIEGTMLDEKEDAKVDEEVRESRKEGKGRRLGRK